MKKLLILLIMLSFACTDTKLITETPESKATIERVETPQDVVDTIYGTHWIYKSYSAAQYGEALEDGKLIFLYYYSDDCDLCQMQDKVFNNSDVALLMNVHFIAFKINITDVSPAGRKRLNIKKTPTMYMIIPKENKNETLSKMFTGYKNVTETEFYLLLALQVSLD